MKNCICLILLIISFISCEKASKEIETNEEIEICEIIINKEFNRPSGASGDRRSVFEIDLNQDSITDIEIIGKTAANQFISSSSFSVETKNSNWKLIGQRSFYYVCSDSTFSDVDNCLEHVTVYTENCDGSETISEKTFVDIPISFADLETNTLDSIEREKLILYDQSRYNGSVLIDEFKSFELNSNTSYSYIAGIDKFEILLKDNSGNFASIFINKEASSNRTLYIEKVMLCR